MAKVKGKPGGPAQEGLNNIWLTPPEALAPVRRYGPIGLDPCTQPDNPVGAKHFFTEKDDGLAQSWAGYGLVFVNPPFSLTEEERENKATPPMRLWTRKIHEEAVRGTEIIALLPCGTRYSTEYFQTHALCHEMRGICFHRGRIKFIHGLTGKPGKGNNSDSQYLGFNVDKRRFVRAFSPVGRAFGVEWFRDTRDIVMRGFDGRA